MPGLDRRRWRRYRVPGPDDPPVDFDEVWRTHVQALRDDAAGCRALAQGLLRYADAVAEAKHRIEELAVTAGLTIAAGIGVAWLTFGTSVAVAAEVTAGLVYNPVVDEMFWAERGGGAFLNERRLRVAARREIKDALFATGIPFAAVPAPRRLAFARTLGTLMPQVAGIRRFGAAALDLAWVAAGRYDGYWEADLKPWDAAAGVLLVKEAGGFVTDFRGADRALERSEFLAANDALHSKLHKLVANALR